MFQNFPGLQPGLSNKKVKSAGGEITVRIIYIQITGVYMLFTLFTVLQTKNPESVFV